MTWWCELLGGVAVWVTCNLSTLKPRGESTRVASRGVTCAYRPGEGDLKRSKPPELLIEVTCYQLGGGAFEGFGGVTSREVKGTK